MALIHKLFALGAAAAACALVAAPLSASESSSGDPKLGEKIFFDQAFSATPSSIPLRVFEAMPDLDAAFAPEPGLPDSRRNCISNIRQDGLSIEAATAQMEALLRAMFAQKLSGVGLRRDEAALPGA